MYLQSLTRIKFSSIIFDLETSLGAFQNKRDRLRPQKHFIKLNMFFLNIKLCSKSQPNPGGSLPKISKKLSLLFWNGLGLDQGVRNRREI